MKLTSFALAALLLAPLAKLHAGDPPLLAVAPSAKETKEQRDARMAWWREARFGMFIHWGIFSRFAGSYKGKQIDTAAEWIMKAAKIPVAEYMQAGAQFNPEEFDADSWVAIAKQAGMKYIVFTAKHHDGFAMYHTAFGKYNIRDSTPFKRDPVAELAASCKKAGIKFGIYYSQNFDWSNPGGDVSDSSWDPAQKGEYDDYIKRVAAPQIDELVARFQPAVFWFDMPSKNLTPEQASALMASFPKNPGMIYNNRLGGGIQGDTETPEQTIPVAGFPGRDWETCMTINKSWGYKACDTNFKSTSTLLRNLVDIASKGGNYLLNVGPDENGVIPAPEVERLAEMGRWLKVNGEAIYDTTASPFKKQLIWGRATKRHGKLYLHVFDWPTDGKLVVPGLKNKIIHAYLLADAGKSELAVTEDDASKIIAVGEKAPDPLISVVVLEIEGDPEIAASLIKPAVSDTLNAGDNLLEIEVVNRWSNRMIGDKQPADANVREVNGPSDFLGEQKIKTGRYTFSTSDPYTIGSALLPSGLLGPVQLLTHFLEAGK